MPIADIRTLSLSCSTDVARRLGRLPALSPGVRRDADLRERPKPRARSRRQTRRDTRQIEPGSFRRCKKSRLAAGPGKVKRWHGKPIARILARGGKHNSAQSRHHNTSGSTTEWRRLRLYPDVHAPATRCRRSSAAQARARRPRQPAEAATTPQIIFCAATPAPGLRPLVWVNAP